MVDLARRLKEEGDNNTSRTQGSGVSDEPDDNGVGRLSLVEDLGAARLVGFHPGYPRRLKEQVPWQAWEAHGDRVIPN